MDNGIWDKKQNHVVRHINEKHEAGWETQAMNTL
jgi:hypothetical protein